MNRNIPKKRRGLNKAEIIVVVEVEEESNGKEEEEERLGESCACM